MYSVNIHLTDPTPAAAHVFPLINKDGTEIAARPRRGVLWRNLNGGRNGGAFDECDTLTRQEISVDNGDLTIIELAYHAHPPSYVSLPTMVVCERPNVRWCPSLLGCRTAIRFVTLYALTLQSCQLVIDGGESEIDVVCVQFSVIVVGGMLVNQ